MENKNGSADKAFLFKDRIQVALDKLYAFCSPYLSFKSDGEINNSFESFLIPIPPGSGSADGISPSEYFAIVEEILDALRELEQELNAENSKEKVGETSQADSSNRLYASLKRHPE